jgi:hypothetical protein
MLPSNKSATAYRMFKLKILIPKRNLLKNISMLFVNAYYPQNNKLSLLKPFKNISRRKYLKIFFLRKRTWIEQNVNTEIISLNYPYRSQ